MFQLAQSSGSEIVEDALVPNLSIDIPGVSFSDVLKEGDVLHINFLGDYISGLYLYLIGIGTTIAIIFIMVAGLRYALSAGGGNLEGAKTMIRNSVTGLALLLCVYVFLFIINPQLINLKPVELELIERQNLINLSGDMEGDITEGFTYVQQSSFVSTTPPPAEEETETNPPLTKGELFCPGSGDATQIIESFYGYVTYRFGGKGGEPPYEAESGKSASGEEYSTFCPEGTFCLDCSGFVAMTRKCAGLSDKGASTGVIFKNAPKIKSCTATTVTTEDGKVHALVPGDLIGWAPGDNSFSKYGHAMIYVRPNRLLESVGRRDPGGNAVGETKLTTECASSVLRYVSN